MKALKAFIKPFKAPQVSENKILTFILILLSEMHGTGRVNVLFFNKKRKREFQI